MRSPVSKPVAAAGALLALAALLAALPLWSQGPRSREAVLAEIRSEMRRLEGELEQARRRQTSLEDRLESTRLELALQGKRLEEAVAARELAGERVAQSREDVEALAAAVAEARELLSRRLSSLYRLGRHGQLRLLLSIDPDDDLLPAVRMLRFLVRRDARVVERYTEAREHLEAERRVLLERQRESERWAREETGRRDGLAGIERRLSRLLAQAEEERRRLAVAAEDLERRERRLTELMVSLERLSGDEALAGGTPIQEYRGVLDWPADGRVTARFGPRLDPRYGTQTPHNGIELGVEPGSRVRAVFPGKVLFAAPLSGYGPTVVMLHPGRGFTLYAGLDRLLVASEDVVSLGDPVGVAGRTLYFEIRIDNRPRDPLDWLR